MRNLIFAILMLAGIVLLAQASGFAASPSLKEGAIRDRALEKRLKVETSYTSRRGDSFRGIAYYLYGHRTWWIKLREMNPSLANLGPESRIPEGTRIRYFAPRIGDTYVVRPNDWLIRIVEWKYGARDYWEKVFRGNADRISNPNLIRPGDKLTLFLDGTVARAQTGEILVRGTESPRPQAMRMPAQAPAPAVTFGPRTPALIADRYSVFGIPGSFVIGFGVGIFAFLAFPVVLWLKKRDPEQDRPEPFRSYLADNSRSKREKAKASPRVLKRKRPEGHAPGFKRRASAEPVFDRSWLPRMETTDIDRRPGYFSLTIKKKKPLDSE